MLKTWFEIPLWQRVVTALILGVLTGWAWGPDAESIKWIGDFFIKAIKMLVVPLIFFSLVSGVAAIGDLRKLGAAEVSRDIYHRKLERALRTPADFYSLPDAPEAELVLQLSTQTS